VLLAASRAGPGAGERGWAIVARCVPFIAVAVGYGILRSLVVARAVTRETSVLSLGARLLTLPEVVVTYLGLLVAPVHLHMERSLSPASPGEPGTWAALVLLLAAGAAAIVLRRSAWPVAFGIAWFAVALLPVSNVVPLATFLAEHWLYVPSIGLFLAAGWTLTRVGPARRTRLAMLALLVAVYGARTVRRNADWRDERTLLETTLDFAPNSARVHANLGRVYLAAGDVPRAKAALARAVELEPDHVRAYDANVQLGLIAQHERRYEEAMRHYRRAIDLNARPAGAYVNLASLLQEVGRVEEARQALEAALVADPSFAVAHLNLGNMEAVAGDLAAARASFERAIELDPELALAHENLGRVHLIERRPALAEREFRRALELNPDSARARTGLQAALGMR
jgi:Tfp pilus assembly protein PilF